MEIVDILFTIYCIRLQIKTCEYQGVCLRQKSKADLTVGNTLSFNRYFGRHGLPKYRLKDNIFPTVKSALLFCLIFSLIAD